MLNKIFVAVVLASILLAAWSGRMKELSDAMLNDSGKAVTLAIGLVGVMALFLGLMRVVQEGGLMRVISRAVAPLMRRLFPSVPAGHPAMDAMILNIAANMMGLTNAATPFGIKAMEELNRLNTRKGTATNAMVLFLAINTAGLAVLPSGVVGLRAALGSQDALGIAVPTWFASGTATLVGITAAFLLARLPRYRRDEPPLMDPAESARQTGSVPAGGETVSRFVEPLIAGSVWRRVVAWLFCLGFVALAVRYVVTSLISADQSPFDVIKSLMSFWMLPGLVTVLVLFGWARGVRVYDALVEGAKDGFQVALRIIPFLVAILVAVGMFRASGGLDMLISAIAPFTDRIGLPAEALPMAILRPLSGSGAYGVMAEIMQTHGADSFIGYLVSTFQGSTETTFYVLAVYYGAVGIRHTRHTLPACLTADLAGILAATFIVNLLFG